MVQIIPNYAPQARNLPIIGKWMGKIGRMEGIAAIQCTPTPTIWVRAFWHNLPFLVYSLVVPDCEDFVSGLIRGGRHHRRRYVKFNGGVAVQGEGGGPGFGWRFWRLYDLGQRVGWYFCLIDANLDFAINWMSTAYIWNGCPVPSPGYANWNTGPDPYVEAVNDDWDILSIVLADHNGIIADANGFVAPQGEDWAGTLSVNCVPGPFNPEVTPIESRIVDGAGNVYAQGTAEDNGEGGYMNNIMFHLHGGVGGTVYVFQVKAETAGLWYITGSHATASVLSGKWANPLPCFDLVTNLWK